MNKGMVQASGRAGFAGPALARVLSRLTGATMPLGADPLPADRLGQWLAWTDAIGLSTVLDSAAPPQRAGNSGHADSAGNSGNAGNAGSAGNDDPVRACVQECAQARRVLTESINDDALLSGAPRRETGRTPPRAAVPPSAPSTPDYETYRERYVFLQRAMASRVAGLRARLRKALAARGGELARLAALDAVMEPVTGARERGALGAIPALLAKRYAQLSRAGGDAIPDKGPNNGPDSGPDNGLDNAPNDWLNTFRQDVRGVLLAELDLRLLPVEGLVEALQGR